MIDDLSDEDYRDIFLDLREGRSLRSFAARMQSMVPDGISHAAWDRYEKDPTALTLRMKCELRAAMGLPVVPLQVCEAVDEGVSVFVLSAGFGVALDQVVIGSQADERWGPLLGGDAVAAPARVRRKLTRPCATPQQDARRRDLGLDWQARH